MRSEVVAGEVVLVVHDKDPVSDAAWNALVEQLAESCRSGAHRVLVYTEGGGPSVVQRARLGLRLRDAKPKVAVITDSPVARGIVKGFAWSGIVDIAGFAPDRAGEAVASLNLSKPAQKLAVERLQKFRQEISMNSGDARPAT